MRWENSQKEVLLLSFTPIPLSTRMGTLCEVSEDPGSVLSLQQYKVTLYSQENRTVWGGEGKAFIDNAILLCKNNP